MYWKPFVIDAGTAEGGEPYAAYNERRWGGDGWTAPLRRKGASVGAKFENWKTWPNTMRAHQLLLFAPHDREAAVKTALFEAIYEKGENASDPETLCEIARRCGVDEAGFRKILDTRDARTEVARHCEMARARGVGGVPYFVVHGSEAKQPIGFSGAVDASELAAIFTELL